ncbi:MAG: S-layer protein [Methanoregula sp.]|nr:S-layer protein [Methanoregula sp.]
MKYPKTILIFLVLLLLGITPVMGLTTYVDGSPQMYALISGTNEFSPGQDVIITLIVQNRGVSTMKNAWVGGNNAVPVTTRPDHSRDLTGDQYAVWQGNGNIARDDLPTTAKMVMVGLSSGNSPVIIKSDPQNIGDIATQGYKTVKISAKIPTTASNDEYQLPLTIGYTYLAHAEELAADVLQSRYVQKNETVQITLRIKPLVNIDVLEAVPENLNVGSGGYLNLTIKNIGFEDGKKATVKILRNGQSPIIPTDSSVFVGDFPSNGTITCRYKVAISGDAAEQTYPVDVAVTYENRNGDIVTSATDTVGIPVRGKLTFSVTSAPARLTPGSDAVITVVYKNLGDTTAYHSQARISVVDPFTSSDDTSYLGDIKPGENVTARYQVHAGDDAEIKTYLLDAEIRYRDSQDNSQVSDTFKVPVAIEQKSASGSLVSMLPVLALLVIAGIGAGYYLLVMRKKK